VHQGHVHEPSVKVQISARNFEFQQQVGGISCLLLRTALLAWGETKPRWDVSKATYDESQVSSSHARAHSIDGSLTHESSSHACAHSNDGSLTHESSSHTCAHFNDGSRTHESSSHTCAHSGVTFCSLR